MRVGILAEKIGMSRFYDNHRVNQAVTLLKVSNSRLYLYKTNKGMDINGNNLHG